MLTALEKLGVHFQAGLPLQSRTSAVVAAEVNLVEIQNNGIRYSCCRLIALKSIPWFYCCVLLTFFLNFTCRLMISFSPAKSFYSFLRGAFLNDIETWHDIHPAHMILIRRGFFGAPPFFP